jgi:cell division protein FtsB
MRRLAALGVIAVVLTVLLAPAVRSYVAQRQQISELRAQVADQRAEVADLQRQRRAWDDPAFVKAQARERLKFVLPGERAYTVIDPGSDPSVQPASDGGQVAVPPAGQDRAWFGTLWRSAEIAGAATAPR